MAQLDSATLTGDGQVEVGYRWVSQTHGAHARVTPGDDNLWNRFGIGICLVGDFRTQRPSARQVAALRRLVAVLRAVCDIPAASVVGHRDVRRGTLCPGRHFPVRLALRE